MIRSKNLHLKNHKEIRMKSIHIEEEENMIDL